MLKIDSRKIEPGDTFIAIKFANKDGHDYIEEAIDRGAACIIAQHGEYPVKTIIVPDTRIYLENYLKELYSNKLDKMKLVGITGTNGKTTSCYLSYQLLNMLGIKAAYIGTLGFYTEKRHIILNNTTPDLYELFELFEQASKDECSYIIMEISSQALDMRRVESLKFDIVGFTNLTQDHLDYHKTFDNYKNAKLKLFKQLKKSGYAIINTDDKNAREFILEKNKNILIGTNNCNFKISNITLENDHSTFKITSDNEGNFITLPMPGKYNIYNYLIAYVICDRLGFNASEIIEKSLSLKAPQGRYQVIKNNTKTVIIDYAHTPDAVLNIITSVKSYSKGRVITLIGCGGDRDKSKRPIMGKIASDNSDFVYFTSDNPRTEDPNQIINDIIINLKTHNYEVIIDRQQAIKTAITNLIENDTLLILGKGHENYQIIGNQKFPFDDYEEVMKYLKK